MTRLSSSSRQLAIIASAVALCGGCKDPQLIVESDTEWSGAIAGDNSRTSQQGNGNHSFTLRSGLTCWTFQKETAAGTLRAYAVFHALTGRQRKGDATTVANYGVVSGCTE